MTEFPPRTLYGTEGGDGRDMPPGSPPDNSGVGAVAARLCARSGGVPTPCPASSSDAGGQPSPRDSAGEGAPASEPPHSFPPLDHPWWPKRRADKGGLLDFMVSVSVRYLVGGGALCVAAWMVVDAMAPQFAALAWALGAIQP